MLLDAYQFKTANFLTVNYVFINIKYPSILKSYAFNWNSTSHIHRSIPIVCLEFPVNVCPSFC